MFSLKYFDDLIETFKKLSKEQQEEILKTMGSLYDK
jgi:hypothetical protein